MYNQVISRIFAVGLCFSLGTSGITAVIYVTQEYKWIPMCFLKGDSQKKKNINLG